MSKPEPSSSASDTQTAAGAEFAPKQMIERRLLEVIADLDGSKQTVAAAYAQMALDLIRCAPAPRT